MEWTCRRVRRRRVVQNTANASKRGDLLLSRRHVPLLSDLLACNTMDLFTELFEHQRELHVIICRPCATAIPPAQIVTHLRTRHTKVPVALRNDIAAIVHTLPTLAWCPACQM